MNADRNRMRQVLANLVDDAIKYTPSGGSIAILDAYHDQDQTVILVKDTGVGIPPEEILPRFGIASTAAIRVAHQPGLGLGLS